MLSGAWQRQHSVQHKVDLAMNITGRQLEAGGISTAQEGNMAPREAGNGRRSICLSCQQNPVSGTRQGLLTYISSCNLLWAEAVRPCYSPGFPLLQRLTTSADLRTQQELRWSSSSPSQGWDATKQLISQMQVTAGEPEPAPCRLPGGSSQEHWQRRGGCKADFSGEFLLGVKHLPSPFTQHTLTE